MFPRTSTASPKGDENDPPSPSINAATPLPAIVETTPPTIVTTRMRWEPASLTYRTPPASSSAMPTGDEKPAFVPVASAYIGPPPARVETMPLASLRMRNVNASAIKTVKSESTTRAWGELKVEASAAPLINPVAPVPASVDVNPAGVIPRMRWLPLQAIERMGGG